MPAAVPCRSTHCSHVQTFGDHFNKEEWDEFVRESQEYRESQRENDEDGDVV